MSGERTLGQVAYETYDEAASARDGVRLPPWRIINEAHQGDWEAAAQAVIKANAEAIA